MLRTDPVLRTDPRDAIVPRTAQRVAAGGLFAAIGFLALTLLVAARVAPVPRFDAAISDAAHRFTTAHSLWRTVMTAVTHSADTTVLVPIGLVALMLLLWRRRWGAAAFLLAMAAGTTVIRLTVLMLVARPRPVDRLAPSASWAYPSGHTTAAAVTAVIVIAIGLTFLTGRWARVTLVATALAWATLVGVSRVALVVHWPTDVLGGWLLVTAVTLVVCAGPLRPRAAASNTDVAP